MLKKEITFVDYNDVIRTETHYFNLNKAEVIEMEYGCSGGLTQFLKNILAQKNEPEIMAFVKKLILSSYGIKSPDGRRFMKSKEISEEFSQTEAYSNLLMELLSSASASVDFVTAILPPMPKSDNTATSEETPSLIDASAESDS